MTSSNVSTGNQKRRSCYIKNSQLVTGELRKILQNLFLEFTIIFPNIRKIWMNTSHTWKWIMKSQFRSFSPYKIYFGSYFLGSCLFFKKCELNQLRFDRFKILKIGHSQWLLFEDLENKKLNKNNKQTQTMINKFINTYNAIYLLLNVYHTICKSIKFRYWLLYKQYWFHYKYSLFNCIFICYIF